MATIRRTQCDACKTYWRKAKQARRCMRRHFVRYARPPVPVAPAGYVYNTYFQNALDLTGAPPAITGRPSLSSDQMNFMAKRLLRGTSMSLEQWGDLITIHEALEDGYDS